MSEHDERLDGPQAPAVNEPPPLYEDMTSRNLNDDGSPAPLTGWHRVKSAAAFVGVPRQTFADAVERKELPYVELDGVRFFAEHDLLSWHVERLPDPEAAASDPHFQFEATA